MFIFLFKFILKHFMRSTRIGRLTRGFFYTTFVFYFLAFFFGAQLFSFETFLFAFLLSTTTFLPLNISCSESIEKVWNCWDNCPQTIFQLYSIRIALGSLIGSWFGVFVIPLDWNRWWQHWPICSIFGLFIFSIIGALTAYFRLFTYPFIKMFPIVVPKPRRPSEIDDQQQQQIPSDTISKSLLPTEITSTTVERYFQAPEPPKLRAIIFAEFDNDIGRVLRFQIPCQIFDKQRFESISSAIIPSEEMRGRMINVNMFENKIIGFPMGIKDKKYPREVLIFNLCFVVSKQVEYDWVYEPLVQKCAEYLIELEKERLFISEEKLRLPILMREIFLGLNNKGECFYTITEKTTIYLKLFSNSRGLEPPLVTPFSVPIFTRIPPPISQEQIERMDVLSQKICPQIDGIRCVKDIACIVRIDNDLVARCIRNLCFYGFIKLLPMFLYFNCYIPTKKIKHFIESPVIVERCQRFTIIDSNLPIAKTFDIFRLYLGLKHGLTLHSWFLNLNPRKLNIDERKLIQFGVHHGFIRKLNIYPIAVYEDGTKISSLCTGEYSLDDLALRYVCSPVELHRRLALNGNFQFIYR